jgi:DNA transposition AAA+ family ATPase
MAKLPEKSEISKAINQYCSDKGISKNALAEKLKVSSATLSKIENNDWETINDRLWRKIWDVVSPNDENIALIETNNLATSIYQCELAREKHFMIGLIGDTGLGKTTALKMYARRKNVYYLAYDKTLKPKQFFAALLREMCIPFEGTINEMVNRISEELNTQENPLILIDEAGKITHTMILYLHVLRDKTDKNCGIILSGMPYFKANLIKMTNKQKEGYSEFYRRINLWTELKRPSKSEIETICELNGITSMDEIKEFQKHRDFGNLHNAIILHKLSINQ